MENAVTFSQKWGDDPFTHLGHTQVPDALIVYQARLCLTDEECWLIAKILRFKYDQRNPYPSQQSLADQAGKDLRSVQRTIARLKGRGLLNTVKVRGNHGHYDHVEYDFTPLRFALNECYYQDHPQDRKDVSIRQKRQVDDTTNQTTNSSQPSDHSTRQIRRAKKMSPNQKFSNQQDITLNVAESGLKYSSSRARTEAIETLILLTGDEKSRNRFEQLWSIADQAGQLECWDNAYRAVEARLKKATTAIERPGAYFQTVVTALLNGEGVAIPVGDKEERADIHKRALQSLGPNPEEDRI